MLHNAPCTVATFGPWQRANRVFEAMAAGDGTRAMLEFISTIVPAVRGSRVDPVRALAGR